MALAGVPIGSMKANPEAIPTASATVTGSTPLWAPMETPSGNMIYFLRRIPPDPMALNAGAEPSLGWGLRSYESDADDPHEGKDVYDVYALSDGVGINHVPYRRW